MSMIGFLLALFISGLVTGALARLALPGRDPMTILQTAGIGIAGSFIAGLVVYAIDGENRGAGFVLSVAVTTGLVYLVRRSRGGDLTHAAPRGGRPVRR